MRVLINDHVYEMGRKHIKFCQDIIDRIRSDSL